MTLEVIEHDGSGAIFRPATHFRPAQWPKAAAFVVNSHHHDLRGLTNAQRNGKRYEKHVLNWLDEQTDNLVRSPWIGFSDKSHRDRVCQPDALIMGERSCTIVEVKRAHTLEAYYQLRKLYEPVVKVLFPGKITHVLEITASFDPRLPWPEDICFLTDLEDLQALGDRYGVMQWRK